MPTRPQAARARLRTPLVSILALLLVAGTALPGLAEPENAPGNPLTLTASFGDGGLVLELDTTDAEVSSVAGNAEVVLDFSGIPAESTADGVVGLTFGLDDSVTTLTITAVDDSVLWDSADETEALLIQAGTSTSTTWLAETDEPGEIAAILAITLVSGEEVAAEVAVPVEPVPDSIPDEDGAAEDNGSDTTVPREPTEADQSDTETSETAPPEEEAPVEEPVGESVGPGTTVPSKDEPEEAPEVAATELTLLQESDGHPDVASGSVDLRDVHVDVGARIIDGSLWMLVKDGTSATTPVWREPSDVLFHANEASEIEIPDNAAFRFLGTPGSQSWVLPQVQRSGLLWPGWNTEAIDPAAVSGGVTWRLTRVQGPGDFAIFLTNSFGVPNVLFDSANGLPDSMEIPLGTHAHGNWAFSAPGDYRLTFEMTARLADGTTLSDSEVIRFAVHGQLDAAPDDDTDDDEDTDPPASTDTEESDKTLPTTGITGTVPLTGLALGMAGTGTFLLRFTRPRGRHES